MHFLPRGPPTRRRRQKRPWAAGFRLLRGPGSAGVCCGRGAPGMHRQEPPRWRGRSLRGRLPVPRRAQSPGPGRGAQVLGGSLETARAGGASIVRGSLRSSRRGGAGKGSPWLGSRLFSTRLRTRRVRRRRQQQAPWRGDDGGGGGRGGGGVCARLAFPPPRLGERGGGEGRAEAGISRLNHQGPKRGTRCPPLPTAPCDFAPAAQPGQASHTRATAAAVRVSRGLPPLPASPLPGGPSSARPGGSSPRLGEEVRGTAPSSPSAGSWPAVRLGLRGRGAPRVIKALAVGCAVARPVLGGLFIAGGTACRSLGQRGSQQVALPARSLLPPYVDSRLLPLKGT